MTTRERIAAILEGEAPDTIPWVPRIGLWYRARKLSNTLPEEWKDSSLREVESDLFGGTAARGSKVFTVEYEGVEVDTTTQGDKKITEYRTPIGSVRTVERSSTELRKLGLPGRVEEELLKGPKDYSVWEYVVEHTVWKPCYDLFEEYDEEVGLDGIPMPEIGDVPFHEFVRKLAGYKDAFYQLADYGPEVEHLIMVMTGVQRERLWPVVLNSPAKLIVHGTHLSTQFTPPALFERYILPYCREFYPPLREHGKKVAMHADNDTSQIAELIESAGWDMVECFVTSPMVPMTLARAKEVWGSRVVVWGGIPSVLFSPSSYSVEEFRRQVEQVFQDIKPGDGVILGVADNVMPDSDIERVRWVTEYVEEHGRYPIQ